jgi:predicted RNA binding protein YcfA (HicA-like mRNA interferase family)
VSGRKTVRALQKAGFEMGRTRGDHARLHNPATGRRTVVSLTSDVLPVGTLASILRQAGLTTEEFRKPL